ncbi:MAG: hypothetical protein IT307_11040 [Chloroflexi bacterium]|nr:hypothetical protein [Chloroflexota bacterium]
MLKKAAFWLILLVFLAGLSEAALQVLARVSKPINAVLSVQPIRQAVRNSRLGWRGNPDWPEHDQLGFRNPGVPVRPTMTALGDSQTYGSHVPSDAAWPRQLSALGSQDSYNMGFPGWGPAQLLLELDEALALKPAAVVTAIYTGNDLVDAYAFVYDSNQLRDFRTKDERARDQFRELDDTRPFAGDLLAHQDTDGLADPRQTRRPPRSLGDLIAGQSRLYALGVTLSRIARRQGDPTVSAGAADLEDGDIPLATEQLQTVLTPRYRGQAVDLADPRVAEGLRLTLELVDRMQARAEAAGARFGVVLIPTKELALSRVASAVNDPDGAYARLVRNETEARAQLLTGLRARDIPHVDSLPGLRAEAAQGELPYSATRDGHLSVAGQRAVASAVDSLLSTALAPAR